MGNQRGLQAERIQMHSIEFQSLSLFDEVVVPSGSVNSRVSIWN